MALEAEIIGDGGAGSRQIVSRQKTCNRQDAAERTGIDHPWPYHPVVRYAWGCGRIQNEAAAAAADRGRDVHMMRIAVTGSMGQVATSLIEQAGREFEIVLLGRRVLARGSRGRFAGLKAARPDVVINAAA